MYPPRFKYLPARSVDEAVDALARYGYDAKVLAGGQSLIPMMKLRLAAPSVLVDISHLGCLSTIEMRGENLGIGAMVTESALERCPFAARWTPALVDTSRVVADPLVRNVATVGGNAAHGDPANDHPATLVATGASFTLVGPVGSRTVAAEDFFVDLFTTALEPDELLTEIVIPRQKDGTGSAYVKYERQVGDYAIGGAATYLESDDPYTIRNARIALTNLGPIPIRAVEAEALLRGRAASRRLFSEAGGLAAATARPWSDMRGSAEYRRRVAAMVTTQSLRRAWKRAGGGLP